MNPALTPTRLAWLRALRDVADRNAANANPLARALPWGRMPRRVTANGRDGGAVTNATFRPMKDAGWITTTFGQIDFRSRPDTYFAITDAGRAVLANASV